MQDYTSRVPKKLLRDYIEITRVIDSVRPFAFTTTGAEYIQAHRLRAKVHDEILAHVGLDREHMDFAMWLAVKTECALHGYKGILDDSQGGQACPA